MPTPTIRTVLGVCPHDYWAGHSFHYIQPVAEAVNGGWFTLTDPSKQFPGKQVMPGRGVFFADLPECRELSAHDISAWEVQSQPDWQAFGLATEYRAVRSADLPYELLPAEVEVTDARTFLTETGVLGSLSRKDGVSLVQFQDGWVLKIRLQQPPHVGRCFAAHGAFMTPLEAWQSFKGSNILTVTSNGKPRRFLNSETLPPDRQWLDMATWDEILESARGGGIGSVGGSNPSELRHARDKIEQLLHFFPGSWWQVRRAKIQSLLDASSSALIAKQEFIEFIASHPAYEATVAAAARQEASKLTDQIRSELLQNEKELAGRLLELDRQIRDKAKELEGRVGEYDVYDRMVKEQEVNCSEATERVESLTRQEEQLKANVEEHRRLSEELAELAQRRAEGEKKVSEIEAEFNRWIAENITATEERDRLKAEIMSLKTTSPDPVVPIGSTPDKITSAAGAIMFVRKNLENVGMNGAMALNVAIESVVAAGGGQIILVRGSLAALLAEILAVSFGGTLQRLQVTLGTSDQLQVAAALEPSAILLDGANLSCPDVYAVQLQRLVQRRMLSADISRFPVIVATILSGPSALPVPASLAALGVSFDTDTLGWVLRTPKAPTVPGRFEQTAFQITEGDAKSEGILGNFKGLTGPQSALWDATARSALRRLAGLTKVLPASQQEASFVAAWLLPWMAANQVALADVRDDVRTMMNTDRAKGDPRVLRMLGLSPGDTE